MKKLRTNIMAGMVAAASVATLTGCNLVNQVIDTVLMTPEGVYGPPPEYVDLPAPVYGPPPDDLIEAVYGPPPEYDYDGWQVPLIPDDTDDEDGVVRIDFGSASSQADNLDASDSDTSDNPATHKGPGLFSIGSPEEAEPEAVYGPPPDVDIDDPFSWGYAYDPANDEPIDVYGPPSDFGMSDESEG